MTANGTGEKKDGEVKHTGSKLVNRPTFIDYKQYKFLVMDAPTDQNLPAYVEALKKKNATWVVRACEGTYSVQPLLAAGIKVLECPFADGDPPPDSVRVKWLELVDQEFTTKPNSESCIAVHCVAGLGRAPALVAIALIEAGMEPLDAIAFIRKKRRGAINARQITYLETYKRRTAKGGCCVIM